MDINGVSEAEFTADTCRSKKSARVCLTSVDADCDQIVKCAGTE